MSNDIRDDSSYSGAEDSGDYGDRDPFLTNPEDELATAFIEPFNWEEQEEVNKEIESILGTIEKQDLAENMKLDIKRRMNMAVGKLTKITEKQQEKAAKAAKSKAKNAFNKALAVQAMATISGDGPSGEMVGVGSGGAGGGVDYEDLKGDVKGDSAIVSIMLQNKVTQLQKQVENLEQKARSVTMQWQTDKERYKETINKRDLDRDEMALKLAILERKLRFLEQKERDPNMIRNNDEANELKAVKEQLEQVEAELADRKTSLSQVSVELSDTKMELNTAQSRIDVLMKRVDDLLRTEDGLHSQIEGLQREKADANGKIRGLEGDIQDLNRRLDHEKDSYMVLKNHSMKKEAEFEDKIQVHLSKIDELKKHIQVMWNEKEEQAKELQAQIDASQRENAKLLLEKESEVRNQKMLVLGLQQLVRTTNRLMFSLDEQVKSVNSQFHQQDNKFDSLHKELTHLSENLGEILSESDRKVKESEEKLAEQMRIFSNQQIKMKSLEEYIEILKKDMKRQEEEAASKVAGLEKTIGGLQQTLESERDATKKAINALKDEVFTLEEELKLERSGPPRYTDEQILAIRIEARDEERAVWIKEVNKLKDANEEMRLDLIEIQKQLEDSRLESEASGDKEQELMNRCVDLETMLDRVNQENDQLKEDLKHALEVAEELEKNVGGSLSARSLASLRSIGVGNSERGSVAASSRKPSLTMMSRDGSLHSQFSKGSSRASSNRSLVAGETASVHGGDGPLEIEPLVEVPTMDSHDASDREQYEKIAQITPPKMLSQRNSMRRDSNVSVSSRKSSTPAVSARAIDQIAVADDDMESLVHGRIDTGAEADRDGDYSDGEASIGSIGSIGSVASVASRGGDKAVSTSSKKITGGASTKRRGSNKEASAKETSAKEVPPSPGAADDTDMASVASYDSAVEGDNASIGDDSANTKDGAPQKKEISESRAKKQARKNLLKAARVASDAIDESELPPDPIPGLDDGVETEQVVEQFATNGTQTEEMEDDVVPILDMDSVEGIVRQSLQTNNYYFSKESGTFSNSFPIDEAFLRELIRSFYAIGESTVTLINKAQKDTFGIDGEVGSFLLNTAKDLIIKMEKSRDDSLNKLKAEHNEQMAERIEETMVMMNNEKNAALYEQADKNREEVNQMRAKYEDQLKKAVIKIKSIREEHEVAMKKAKEQWEREAFASSEEEEEEEEQPASKPEDAVPATPINEERKPSITDESPVAPSSRKSMLSPLPDNSSNFTPGSTRSRRNAIFRSGKSVKEGKGMSAEEREKIKKQIEEDVRKTILAEMAEKQAKVQALVSLANNVASNDEIDQQLAELWSQLPERFQAKGMDLQAMRDELLNGDLSYIGDVRMENFDRLKRDRRFGTDDLVSLTIIEHTMRYDTGEGGSNPFDISQHNEDLTAEQKAAKERQYRMQMKSMEIQKQLLLQKIIATVPVLDFFGFYHATERHLYLLSTLNAWKSLCYYQAGGMFRDVLQVHLEVIDMCIKAAGGMNAAVNALTTADSKMDTSHWPETFRIRALEVFRHQLAKDQEHTRESMERMMRAMQNVGAANYMDHANQHINDPSLRTPMKGDGSDLVTLFDKEKDLQRERNMQQLNQYMASRAASPHNESRPGTSGGHNDDYSVHSDSSKRFRGAPGPTNRQSRNNIRRDSDASDATSLSSVSNNQNGGGYLGGANAGGVKQTFARASSLLQRQVSRIAEESNKPAPSLKSLSKDQSFSIEILDKIANDEFKLPSSKRYDPNAAAAEAETQAAATKRAKQQAMLGGLHYKLDHICFLALRGDVGMYDLLTTLFEGFSEWDECHNIAANNLFQTCLGKSNFDYVDDVVSALIRSSIQSEIPLEMKEVFEKICHVLDICDTYAEGFVNEDVQQEVAKTLVSSITASTANAATSTGAIANTASSTSVESSADIDLKSTTSTDGAPSGASGEGVKPDATASALAAAEGLGAAVAALTVNSEEAMEAAVKIVSKAMRHPLSHLFERRGKSSLSARSMGNGGRDAGKGFSLNPGMTGSSASGSGQSSTGVSNVSAIGNVKSVSTFDCGTQTQFERSPLLPPKPLAAPPRPAVVPVPIASNPAVLSLPPSLEGNSVTSDDIAVPPPITVADGRMLDEVSLGSSITGVQALTVPALQGAPAPVPQPISATAPPAPVGGALVEPASRKGSTISVTKKNKKIHDAHPYGLPRGFTFAFFKDDEFEVCPGVFISAMDRVQEALKTEFVATQIKKQQLLLEQQAEEERIKQEGETYESLMKKKRKKKGGDKDQEEEVDLPSLLLRLEFLPANVRYCYGPNIQSEDEFPQGLRPAPAYLDIPPIEGFRALIFPAVYALRPGINLITGFHYVGQGNDHLFSTLNIMKGKNNSQEIITLPKDLLLIQLMSDFIKAHTNKNDEDDDAVMTAPLPRGLYRATLSDRVLRDPDMFKLRKDVATFENNPEKKNAKKTFIRGKAVEVINNQELEIPLGHELVQLQDCLIDFPVGVEVSPGVRIAATPANIVLPDNIRLVKKARKTPLPTFMKSLTEATDDADVNIGAKMNECITIVSKPKNYNFELGMELIRRPLGHPLPEGMTPVPMPMYPEGLVLPDDLELVQLTPKFDFPPECRLTSAWYIVPRPHKVSLRPNQYIIYPDPNLEDHVIPPLPTFACPISMPYIPYGVILPARAQAVELLLSKLTTFPLPEGAMLAPGITVLHPKIFHQNARNVNGMQQGQVNNERKNPAVNVLLVRRLPGTPLPKTVERGSREDLPAGVLLEENMDVVRIAVRFELPPGVKLDVGVQLGPLVQLCPGTQLISSTLTGNRHHAKQLTVIEWPYGVSLDPGIELVAKPPKGTYLPFEYLQVNPGSRELLQSLPEDAILVRLPRDMQLLSSLQIAERITVGVESVMEEYHRPLPEGVIFASRQTANIQWPSGITSVPRSSLPPKLVQLMDTINSDTSLAGSKANKKDSGGKGSKHVKSNLNVEAVQISAVYELPADIEVIEGVWTVEKPFWIQKHSRLAVLRVQDRKRDLNRLAEKDIFEVRYRPDTKFMEMKQNSTMVVDIGNDLDADSQDDDSSVGSLSSLRSNKGGIPRPSEQVKGDEQSVKTAESSVVHEVFEDVRTRYPLPPDCVIVRLPEVFEVYSWGDALPGIQSVVWDASTSQVALPPGHFLIQRPRNKIQDELPPGFQLGICEHYRQLRVPSLPPQLEIMHLLPSRHLPRGVNLINTSVIGRNQFNNFVGQTMMSGGSSGGTYTKKSFQPYWIPQLSPFEPVSQHAVIVPWPTSTNTYLADLEELDGQLFREPHALIWMKDPRLGTDAYPGNISKHPKSDQIVELLFPEPLDDNEEGASFLTGLLTSAVKKRQVLLHEVLHVVKVSNGFPNPRDRFKNPSAASKGSLAPINADDDEMVVYPRLNRVQRLQLLDPTVEVNKFLAAIHAFRFGKDPKEMEMELKHLRFDIMESALFKALAGSEKVTREVDRLKAQLRKSHAANTNMQKALDMIQSEFQDIKDQLQDQDDLKAIIAMLKRKLEEKSKEIEDISQMRQDNVERMAQQLDVLTSQLSQYRNSGLNPIDDLTAAERFELKKKERAAMEKEVRVYLSKEIAADMQTVLRRQILAFANLFTSSFTRLIVTLDKEVFHKYLSSFQVSSIVEAAEKREMQIANGEYPYLDGSVGSVSISGGRAGMRRDSFEEDNQSAISAITEHLHAHHAHGTEQGSLDGGVDGGGSIASASVPASHQFPYFQPEPMPDLPKRAYTDLSKDQSGKRLPVTPAFPVDVKSLYGGVTTPGGSLEFSDDENSSFVSFAKSLPPMPRQSPLSPVGQARIGMDLASQSQPNAGSGLSVSKSSDNVMLSRTVGDLLKRRKIQQGKRMPEKPHAGLRLPRLADDPVITSNGSVTSASQQSLNGSPNHKSAAGSIASSNPYIATLLLGDEAQNYFDAQQSPFIMKQLHRWSEESVAALEDQMTYRVGDIEASIFHVNVRIQEVLSELLTADYKQLVEQRLKEEQAKEADGEQKAPEAPAAVLMSPPQLDKKSGAIVFTDESRPQTEGAPAQSGASVTFSLASADSVSTKSTESAFLTLTANSKQWKSIEELVKQSFGKLFDFTSFFVSSQHQSYFHSLTLLETENRFLSRELQSTRQRVDLLQQFVNEQKKQLQSQLGVTALETITSTAELREKIVSQEAKIARLLEGQVKEEVKTLRDQIDKVVHLNDLDKQYKFSAFSLKQICLKEESKLPKNHVANTGNNTQPQLPSYHVPPASEALSEKEIKAIRHHCQRLKKQANSFEERSVLIQQEIRDCISGLLEHMENYQRSVQPVLPPKILTMMLQRSLQYYERLKAAGSIAPGHTTTTSASVQSSNMSVQSIDSAALSLPMAVGGVEGGSSGMMPASWLDDSDDASSQVSQSSMQSLSQSLSHSVSLSQSQAQIERERGREKASEQRLNILTDASKSLHQQKVKFGNIGSIPAATEKSHLTKRLPPPSKLTK